MWISLTTVDGKVFYANTALMQTMSRVKSQPEDYTVMIFDKDTYQTCKEEPHEIFAKMRAGSQGQAGL